MPMSAEAPYHHHPWPAGSYYNLIVPFAKGADVWETHYHHVLADIHAVTTWVSGDRADAIPVDLA